MAKWHGKIGYIKQVQTAPSVWRNQEEVREYSGDITRNYSSKWTPATDSTNDELSFDNQVSIVADQFAYQNFYSMKWIELWDAKWKITKVEVQHPRLILMVGGVYNG